MLALLEAASKRWLAESDLPVPRGAVARSVDDAVAIARTMPDGAVVKAHVAAGRRGKAGGVRLVDDAGACAAAAGAILGSTVAGLRVDELYVEARHALRDELYLAFGLDADGPFVLLSRHGGVDIEGVHAQSPDAVVRASIDALRGLTPWDAIELWIRAGVAPSLLRDLGPLTSRLYEAFVRADAVTLEINPLAVEEGGALLCIGAMMAIDEHALHRHAAWATAAPSADASPPADNPREASVREANRLYPGGEAEYRELDGDIGLLVGGGGAGLYLHDCILALGGHPANHSVTPPTGANTGKLKTVVRAILDNPGARGLLVGFNFAQMARNDIRMQAIAEVFRERALDPRRFPVVVRFFGGGEPEARRIAATLDGVEYMDPGTTLHDAARRIVERVAAVRTTQPSIVASRHGAVPAAGRDAAPGSNAYRGTPASPKPPSEASR